MVWATCQQSRRWLERSGLPLDVFFEPFSFDGQTIFLPEELIRITPKTTSQYRAPLAQWISQHIELVDQNDRERVLFAGASPSDDPVALFPEAADSLDRAIISETIDRELARNGYTKHFDCMLALMARFNLGAQTDVKSIIALHQIVVNRRMQKERLPTVRAIAEALGDDFLLIGSGWDRYGLNARLDSFDGPAYIGAFFRLMRLNLDLGSTSLDTGWYERPIEVLRFGGDLIQREGTQSATIFEEVASDVVFRNQSELLDLVPRPSPRKLQAAMLQSLLSKVAQQAVGKAGLARLKTAQ